MESASFYARERKGEKPFGAVPPLRMPHRGDILLTVWIVPGTWLPFIRIN
jgi:hypothetical protein